jgi:ketosteroid isomerase-like protein
MAMNTHARQLLFIPLTISALGSGCATSKWQPGGAEKDAQQQVDTTEGGLSWNPYHNVVRSKIVNAFTALNRRDPNPSLELMANDVEYTFQGDHALGGTRHSREAVRLWFARLLHLIPSQFQIRSIEVTGAPWNTQVRMAFEDHVKPLAGPEYINTGVQVTQLKWGKAVRIQTTVDNAKLVRALQYMAQQGVAEATLKPIVD